LRDITIGQILVINGGGKTVMLTDLPEVDPHEEGKLYITRYDDFLRVPKG